MKTNKKSQKPSYVSFESARQAYYPVPPPEVFTIDTLDVLNDDDLNDRDFYLHDEMERVVKLGGETRLWEIEICYVQREQDIRSTRHNAHVAFNNERSVNYTNRNNASQ
jgi:hypothetical protein